MDYIIIHFGITQLKRPNGVALSLDESVLYVANSHQDAPMIIAVDLSDPLHITASLFFDGSALAEKDAGHFDGLKVHSSGTLFATGPGGVLVIDSQGKHLGTVRPEALTANCAFDTEENYLYMTSDHSLTRIRLR